MSKKKKCEHPDESFVALGPPHEGTYRCECGALGYRRGRPSHRGARKQKVRLYKCRVKGCKGLVVERKFAGWNLANGCAAHPIKQ